MAGSVSWQVLGLGVGAAALAGCSPKIASMKVEPAKATLEAVSQTAQFKVSEFDDNGKPLAKNEPVTWASDNPAVAPVEKSGTATAKKTGHANLTATAGKFKGTASVDVRIPAKIVGQDVALNWIGKTQDVAFQVLDEDGQPIADLYTKIAVTLADPKVASVSGPSSGNWTFSATLPGKTQITASVGSLTQTFNLAVELPIVTDLKLGQASLKMKVGDSQPLGATAQSSGKPIEGQPFSYASSEPKVATVDADGTVHAIGKGKAVVTVTAGAKSATVAVSVKK